MKPYRYVDLPNLDKIQEIVLERLGEFYINTSIFKVCAVDDFAIPELIQAVETIKPWNDVLHVAVITQEPFGHINNPRNIHKDVMSYTSKGQEQPVVLNIPIYNCLATYLALYKPLTDPYLYKGTYPNGHEYEAWHWKKGGVEEIDRLYLHKAALFNTQVPHSIINETKKTRIIISVRFSSLIKLKKYA